MRPTVPLITILGVCLGGVALASVPPRTAITLEEALSRALADNPGLGSARQSEGVAHGRTLQSRAGLMPRLAASAYRTNQSRPQIQSSGFSAFGGGGLFAGEVEAQRVTLTQRVVSPELLHALRAAQQNKRASRSDVRKAEVDLASQVKRAFFDAMLADTLVAVQQATVDQVQRQLDQARMQVAAGTLPRLDELRAQVQLANVKPQLIQAQFDRDVAQQALANLLGIEASIAIETKGDFLPVKQAPSRPAAIGQAVRERPDLQAARLRLESAQRQLASARSAYYPTVDLGAAVDKSMGQRFPIDQSITIESATVTVSLPLFDGGQTHGRVREAQAGVRKARLDVEALRQAVELDVCQVLSLVAQSGEVIAATETAIMQAEEALDIAQEGYRLGARTYLEVLDAQLALAVSRTNRARARRDHSVALARLDQAIGTLGGHSPAPPTSAKAAPTPVAVKAVTIESKASRP